MGFELKIFATGNYTLGVALGLDVCHAFLQKWTSHCYSVWGTAASCQKGRHVCYLSKRRWQTTWHSDNSCMNQVQKQA